MNKEANLSAMEALLYSGALGAGGFGTIKLLQEAMQKMQGRDEENNPEVIPVNIPRPMPPQPTQKFANSLVSAPPAIQPPAPVQPQASTLNQSELMKGLAALVGLPTGFMGGKFLYDHLKGQQIKADNKAKEEAYMQELASYKTAAEKEHPFIDQICESFLDAYAKQAEIPDVPGVSRETAANIIQQHKIQGALGLGAGMINKAGLGIPESVLYTLLGIGGASALGVGGAMIMNDRKKEELAQKPRPEDLRIQLAKQQMMPHA